MLLDTFFLAPTAPAIPMEPAEETPLDWHPLSTAEIHQSLLSASGRSAAGPDTLPMLVWQKLWPYISDTVYRIFAASLDLGHHPTAWRTATIVILQKPQKPDKTVPGAYRPISLLNTLGKLLEAVIAKRLSHYAEKHSLLPNTQFGGRPGRSTEQALLILVDAIWTAWR